MTGAPRGRGGPPRRRWAGIDPPVHHLEQGPPEAPPLVCVHGLGGSALDFTLLAPLLAGRYRVVCPDLPAHGRTRARRRDGTLADAGEHLDRFVAGPAAGGPGRRVVLVGSSLGGLLVLRVAAARPERVRAVVLIDPALPPSPRTPPHPLVALAFAGYALPGTGELMLRLRRRLAPERVARAALRMCCHVPDRVPEAGVRAFTETARLRRDHPDTDAGFLRTARDLLRMLRTPAGVRALQARIPVPALLVHGSHDRYVPLAAARAAASAAPGWRLAVADGAGHLPHVEAPEWVAATVLDWLETLPPVRPGVP